MAIIRNYPDTARNRLLENVAALIFGRDPDSVAPDIGWRATLARHLGMNKNAVSDTMRQPGSPKFDHRLADFVSRKRIAMSRNAIILEHDEVELRGADNPVMKLWIVQITTPVGRSTRLVWGCHAGEVAAFFVDGTLPDALFDKLKIKWSHRYASAVAGSYRIEVRRAREPIALFNNELDEARELVDRFGEAIPPQYVEEA